MRVRFEFLFIAIIYALLNIGTAEADSFRFNGDELLEKYVEIKLTERQVIKPAFTKIALNKEQIDTIRKGAGKTIKWVQYISLKDAKLTCTCMMDNIGVLYPNNLLLLVIARINERATKDYRTREKEID